MSNPLPPEVTAPLGATYQPLEELLGQSDFVTLHVNLSPVTRHLIDATTLAWMKPTAVLVNTSRGPVVDGRALADALRDGTIWAAALDVTDPEPIPMDDPLVGLDNCLIVPHIASASRATRAGWPRWPPRTCWPACAGSRSRRRSFRTERPSGPPELPPDGGSRYAVGGPVAQRQSTGLLIPWSWVRIPPGSQCAPTRRR